MHVIYRCPPTVPLLSARGCKVNTAEASFRERLRHDQAEAIQKTTSEHVCLLCVPFVGWQKAENRWYVFASRAVSFKLGVAQEARE